MKLFLIIFLFIHIPTVFAQARIEPPSVEFSDVPSNTNDRAGVQSSYVNASIPLNTKLLNTMPFVHWQERDRRFTGVDSDQKRFDADRRILFGLLHHPAEGAPEWMLEAGRQGDFQSIGRPIGKVTYNLEKAVPALRPGNSDKLDSWIAVSSIVGRDKHIFTLPELGWTWRQLSSGLVIDFIAPTLMRIGYHEDQWTATFGGRQTWQVVDDPDRSAGFFMEPQRTLLVDATRDLEHGFSVTFSGGLQLETPPRPYVGLGVSWTPHD